MVNVEVCINSSTTDAVRQATTAAYDGGAATIELCAAMHVGGLTPPPSHIHAARQAFDSRRGLMVMIRPRDGDFCYSAGEHSTMLQQIAQAAAAGADGVVFGVLEPRQQRIAVAATQELVAASRERGLGVTFHRAFDATPDPGEALEALIELGVHRVLTCGVAWGRPGTALSGADQIARTVQQARGRIEIVIGGGVSAANAAAILARMPPGAGRLALHAYSSAQSNGVTTAEAVQALVLAANRQA